MVIQLSSALIALERDDSSHKSLFKVYRYLFWIEFSIQMILSIYFQNYCLPACLIYKYKEEKKNVNAD